MPRKKRGRPVNGFLVLDKPLGMTSTGAVGKARWALDAQKAGHAGTLDPLATGILVIAFGDATKVVPYITDDLKAYRFTVRWGIETATDDTEGEAVASSDARPTRDRIEAALPAFVGDIEQVPPAFSAVKVDGQRAYDLARDGAPPELAARPLFVESLELVEMPDADHAVFDFVCGKGGYVRAIARDLGRMLGCGGHVTALRRVWSGPFTLDDAVTADRLDGEARGAELDDVLLPIAAGLGNLPACHVDAAAAAKLRNGNAAPVAATDAAPGDVAWAAHGGTAIAIGNYMAGTFAPTRVIAPARQG